MRAAVLGNQGGMRVEQVSDPAPDRGQLVIQVAACGICGSDLKARSAMPHGTVMGHEFCGEVVAVGQDVGHPWRVGTSAAVLPCCLVECVRGVGRERWRTANQRD